MKKTIILILAVLPIVLLVVIAFAGQILSYYQHIPVERLEFTDRLNNAYTKDDVFTVEQGKTKETKIQVYPTLASNKKVTYSSQDEFVCTIDENGVITGHHYGSTTVTARSEDGGKTVILNVTVKADVPYAVYLSAEEVSMLVGEKQVLGVTVDAPVAVNKSVMFESSDPDIVSVDEFGKLTANAVGEATVTVTTVAGNVTDTCLVRVTEGELPLSFDFSEATTLAKNEFGIYVSTSPTVDLSAYIRTGEGVDPDSVSFRIWSGKECGRIENGVLTFTASGLITVHAYIGDESNPTFFVEVEIGCFVG